MKEQHEDRLHTALQECVHCGFCLPACPTYQLNGREADSPRGRIWLVRALEERRIEPSRVVLGHLDACLDCRACETACPSGVRYGEIIEVARERLEPRRRRPWWQRWSRQIGLRWVLPRRGVLAAVMVPLAVYQRSGLQRLVRGTRLLELWPRLAQLERQQPSAAWCRFTPRSRRVYAAEGAPRGEVQLFTGCVMDRALPETHAAAVRLLRRAGWSVIVDPEQTCCGALHVHNGDTAFARDLARRNVAAFEASPSTLIAVNSAGCGAQLSEYAALLAGDSVWRSRAERMATRVRDVTELLCEAELPGLSKRIERRAVYDEACHLLHAQGISAGPRQLLSRVAGLTVVPLPGSDRCCGAAGIYSLTEPLTAEALLQRKVSEIVATGADLVVTANPGCVFQLRSGLTPHGIEVRHLLDVLAEALV